MAHGGGGSRGAEGPGAAPLTHVHIDELYAVRNPAVVTALGSRGVALAVSGGRRAPAGREDEEDEDEEGEEEEEEEEGGLEFEPSGSGRSTPTAGWLAGLEAAGFQVQRQGGGGPLAGADLVLERRVAAPPGRMGSVGAGRGGAKAEGGAAAGIRARGGAAAGGQASGRQQRNVAAPSVDQDPNLGRILPDLAVPLRILVKSGCSAEQVRGLLRGGCAGAVARCRCGGCSAERVRGL